MGSQHLGLAQLIRNAQGRKRSAKLILEHPVDSSENLSPLVPQIPLGGWMKSWTGRELSRWKDGHMGGWVGRCVDRWVDARPGLGRGKRGAMVAKFIEVVTLRVMQL